MENGDKIPRSRPLPAVWLDHLRLGAAFLTRLPVGPAEPIQPGSLAAAAWAFPLVGLGVGLAAGLVFGLALLAGLTAWLAAILAVSTQLLITGALHEDGLADVADGFGGGLDRERKLEIMDDSRIGAFGVSALVVALLARISAIAAVADPALVLGSLAGAGAASRAVVVGVMGTLEAARPAGLGAAAGTPQVAVVTVAGALGALAAVLGLDLAAGAAALAGAAAAGVVGGALAKRQIGGHTGDVLGAVQQAAETVFLVVVVAVVV